MPLSRNFAWGPKFRPHPEPGHRYHWARNGTIAPRAEPPTIPAMKTNRIAGNDPHYLSVHDLAWRWEEHPHTVYQRIKTVAWLTEVRTIQHGRQLRFLAADVDAFDERRRLTVDSIGAALNDVDDPDAAHAAAAEVPDSPFDDDRSRARTRAAATQRRYKGAERVRAA